MFKKKYTRAELNTLIKDLILAESGGTGIIGSGQAAQQFYGSSGRNMLSGYYAGAGGQPAVAATILAMHNHIPAGKNPTVTIEKNLSATYTPGTDEIIIAGVGQNRTADIAFDMSLIGLSGVTCQLEVKSGLSRTDTVKIACDVHPGRRIPANHFDASIFVLGGDVNNLQQDVTFCVGSASPEGSAFLNKVFGVSPTGNVIADLNANTTANPKGQRIFHYNLFESLPSTETINSIDITTKSGPVAISAAAMNALAWTTYCMQEPKNLQRATQFAAMVSVTQQEVLNVQCTFDQNGSSCFASAEHGNGRFLPCIPNFSSRPQYQAALRAAWPDFVKNAQNCDYYDFSGISPNSAVSYQDLLVNPTTTIIKPTGGGAPINVVFQNKFGKPLQPFLAGKTNANDIVDAIDAILDDGVLSASGMLTPAGVKGFIADVGLDLLIELIQYSVTEKDMLKTAIAAVWNSAEKKGLIAGKIPDLKADIFNEIKSIKLSGTNNINVKPSYGAIHALGMNSALSVVNKYRKKKGWKQIKNKYSLRKLAGSPKFTYHDVMKAMKSEKLNPLYLKETTKYSAYEFKNLIKEALSSSLEGSIEGSENLPSNFSSFVPGEFIASVNMEGLEKLAEILKNEEVSKEIFLDALSNIVSENMTADDNNVMIVAPELYNNVDAEEFVNFTGNVDEIEYEEYNQIENQPDEIEDKDAEFNANQPDDDLGLQGAQLTMEAIRRIVRNHLLK